MCIRALQFYRLRFMHPSHRAVALSFVFLLSAVCVPFGVHAQSGVSDADRDRLSQFQQSLDFLRRQYGIPGLSAVIVNNRRIIWEAGFGFQDVENQIPATPDTPYRTASITKTFASMLLMKCVERGALNLNTPIRNYTSGIADSRVTVRHLFTHTSQSSPPGESYLYSGNRYNFLTPVVESCGGLSFREALAKTILDPLAMNDSVPGQDMEFPSPQAAALFTPETLQRYTRVIQRLAKPYLVDSSGRPILSAYPPTGISAAAGLISTVRDLARYDAAIDQHILLASQTQEQAWTNHVNSKGQRLPYALGWFVQMYGNERLIWHYGQWDTFSGLFLKVPGRNITLILLANSGRLSSPFNALGAGNVTGSPFANLFLQMLADPAAFQANPIDLDSFFVRQQYLDFLNREPDGPGWDHWTREITQCTTDPSKRFPDESEAQCIVRKRADTSAAFFLSPEFQNTGYFVLRVYRGSLGRFPYFGGSVPADNSKDEFTRDHAAVSAGIVVNNQLAPEVMYSNKLAFVNQFVTRSDFQSIYGGLNNEQYVDKLFETTNVSPTATERQKLINGLMTGSETRASVLFKIVDGRIEDGSLVSQTRYGKLFYDQQLNPGFVQMEYFGYMRRDPDDAGYAFWLDKLNQYGGNWVNAEMVLAFMSSPEYRARFGQP